MPPIHVGCLVFDYQAIDVIGPCDLLNSASKRLMTGINFFTPVSQETIARAPEFVFHHIGETLEPAPLLTSALTLVPTATVADCPELDCLIVGGPNVAHFQIPPAYAEFIRRHAAAGKLLFTICTGAAVVAASGALDGKNATVNRLEYEWVKNEYPRVQWTKDQKWVGDGNIWTGSGAVAGMDMISHWLKESFGLDVLVQACLSLDYEPRDINGLFNVLPQRYGPTGEKISTHVFP